MGVSYENRIDHRRVPWNWPGRGPGIGPSGLGCGINYLNRADKARELVEELTAAGCHAAMFQADVADSAAVAEMVRKLGETFSPVELVVNNAGVSGQGLFQDTTDEMWDRYLAVNLSGARNTVKAALPHMISEKRGCIVNISSIWGQRGQAARWLTPAQRRASSP